MYGRKNATRGDSFEGHSAFREINFIVLSSATDYHVSRPINREESIACKRLECVYSAMTPCTSIVEQHAGCYGFLRIWIHAANRLPLPGCKCVITSETFARMIDYHWTWLRYVHLHTSIIHTRIAGVITLCRARMLTSH